MTDNTIPTWAANIFGPALISLPFRLNVETIALLAIQTGLYLLSINPLIIKSPDRMTNASQKWKNTNVPASMKAIAALTLATFSLILLSVIGHTACI